MTSGKPGKGANMARRAVMQHLSLTDWKLANRLPIPAGKLMLSRMAHLGWIEIQGIDYMTIARLTEAGVKAMRSNWKWTGEPERSGLSDCWSP
jgi:hypothetical protein